MSVESRLEQISLELDQLTSEITKFVKSLEYDERLRNRAEDRDERDRNKQHDALTKALEDLAEQIGGLKVQVEGVGVALRDLPDRLLNHVEKKIYELRLARWEALQAGVQNEPSPLPPAPTRREPTGKILTQIAGKEEDEGALTPAEHNAIVKLVVRVWKWKFHIIGGGSVVALIVERLGDVAKWLKALGH